MEKQNKPKLRSFFDNNLEKGYNSNIVTSLQKEVQQLKKRIDELEKLFKGKVKNNE